MSIKDLGDLLGNYQDLAYDIYQEFMYNLQGPGLVLGRMFENKFRLIDPKQDIPFEFILPQTHSRLVTSNYFKMVNPQTKEVFDKPINLRELLSTYFIIFDDEILELTVSFYGKTLFSKKGRVNELTFKIDEILQPKMNGGDMLNVNIKILETGDKRKKLEQEAFFGSADTFAEKLMDKENLVKELSKLSPERLKDRLQLLNQPVESNINDIEPSNFGYTEVRSLEAFIGLLGKDISNEELLESLEEDMEIINLKKMQEWINRSGADGRIKN